MKNKDIDSLDILIGALILGGMTCVGFLVFLGIEISKH